MFKKIKKVNKKSEIKVPKKSIRVDNTTKGEKEDQEEINMKRLKQTFARIISITYFQLKFYHFSRM